MPVSGVITEYEAVLLQLVIERPCWSNGHRQCYCWRFLLKKTRRGTQSAFVLECAVITPITTTVLISTMLSKAEKA